MSGGQCKETCRKNEKLWNFSIVSGRHKRRGQEPIMQWAATGSRDSVSQQILCPPYYLGHIQIVAGIDTYDGIQNYYPVFASLKECKRAQVTIYFSNAKARDVLACIWVWKKQIPILLFVPTGLSQQQLADVAKNTQKAANFKAENMSRNQGVL